jgi:hypothetical protein
MRTRTRDAGLVEKNPGAMSRVGLSESVRRRNLHAVEKAIGQLQLPGQIVVACAAVHLDDLMAQVKQQKV